MSTVMTLRSSFSSAHFYHQPQWSAEKNREVFGRCYTEHGHGHNYTLEVGFYISAEKLHQQKDKFLALLVSLTHVVDHEHLNFIVPEFKDKIPTTENITLYFTEKLQEQLPAGFLSSVRLYEMKDLWSEVSL